MVFAFRKVDADSAKFTLSCATDVFAAGADKRGHLKGYNCDLDARSHISLQPNLFVYACLRKYQA